MNIIEFLFEGRQENETPAAFARRCAMTGLAWTIAGTIGLALVICGLAC